MTKAAGRYIFVWDHEQKTVAASAFVPFPNTDPAVYPTDTTHGIVSRDQEDAFLAQLGTRFPGKRYLWGGGSGPTLAGVVHWFLAMEVEREYE